MKQCNGTAKLTFISHPTAAHGVQRPEADLAPDTSPFHILRHSMIHCSMDPGPHPQHFTPDASYSLGTQQPPTNIPTRSQSSQVAKPGLVLVTAGYQGHTPYQSSLKAGPPWEKGKTNQKVSYGDKASQRQVSPDL